MCSHGAAEEHSIKIEVLSSKVAELEATLRHLTDRKDIVDVLRRYTRGINRHDIALLTSALWPDARISCGSSSWYRDEFVEVWNEQRYLKGVSAQGHHVTNETIDIDNDHAHVESYLISLWRPPRDGSNGVIIGARYVDRLDRRDGEWRIAVREYFPHFWAEATSIFQSSTESWPQYSLGTRDGTDPSYHRPLNPVPRERDASEVEN